MTRAPPGGAEPDRPSAAIRLARTGDVQRAREILEHERADCRGDRRCTSRVFAATGEIDLLQGRPTRAIESCRQARSLAGEAGDARASSAALRCVARASFLLDDDSSAAAAADEAVTLATARVIRQPKPLRSSGRRSCAASLPAATQSEDRWNTRSRSLGREETFTPRRRRS
jgi:hypothetical protein